MGCIQAGIIQKKLTMNVQESNPGNFHPVLLQKRIDDLEEHMKAVEGDLKKLRQERTEEEKRRLKWGISALGAVVMALAGLAWSLLPNNAQEAWQIFRGGSSQ